MSSSIDELDKEIPIGQLAGRLGVSESEAEQAVRSLLPMLAPLLMSFLGKSFGGAGAAASGSDIAD